MLKIFFNFITIVLLLGLCFGQSNKKWQVIKEDSEKIIYLDTKNISEVEDQLSVWSMFVYKVMSKTDENGRRIGKIKNQYVIYKSTKKFSVVGKLIYDEIGRIIRNNSNPIGPSNQTTNESIAISTDDDVKLIFNKAQQFLSTGAIANDVAENDENPDKEEEYTDEEESYEEEVTPEQVQPEVQPARTVKRAPVIPKKTKDNKIVFRKTKTDTSDKDEIPAARPVSSEIPSATPVKSENTDTYNIENEQVVRGVIFTDGNVFVVQKSAWREREKAEKAVRRLKQKGDKAFITEAEIPSKGGTWYRVRVGYFNSLSEAEKYVRTHR